jgi:hypothetical protein
MKIGKELYKEIDSILDNGLNNVVRFHSSSEKVKKAIRICKALNFIKQTSPNSGELCENGILAIQDGGIEQYLSNKITEKDLDFTIKELTGKRLKYDILYNIMYVLIGALISFITILVQPDNSEKYIKQLNKLSSEKNELNDSFEKRLNDMNTLTLELKKEIDSLKK